MKKGIALALCFFLSLLFSAGWVFSGESAAKNGAGWKALTFEQKTFYMMGLSDGYALGMFDGVVVTNANMTGEHPQTPSPVEKKKLAVAAEQARSHNMFGSRTLGQLIDTVSTFYGDYQNAPVCWDEAALLSSASLSGNAPTEQEITTARKLGAEHGCK